jgi:hypothetical protein
MEMSQKFARRYCDQLEKFPVAAYAIRIIPDSSLLYLWSKTRMFILFVVAYSFFKISNTVAFTI